MAKLITREELKGSLRHYWRMRKWAGTQDPEHFADMNIMMEGIKEDWTSFYCVLCSKYYYTQGKDTYHMTCDNCPLRIAGHRCEEDNSPWVNLAGSTSWEDWIGNATKMAQAIIDLPRETEQ